MNDRWKNRRRMAWLAFIAGIVFPLIASESVVVGIAQAFYLFVGTIIGAYIGFSTVDDKWQRSEDE